MSHHPKRSPSPQTESELLAWNLGRNLSERAATPPPSGLEVIPEVGVWLTPRERQAVDRLGVLDFVEWAERGWQSRPQATEGVTNGDAQRE